MLCGPKVRPGTRKGGYLVWSDIPNNRQLRWLEDDGRVSVFRAPSNNSNGNTFDYQGRQLSCEHLMRRVVRYELDGSVTVLADSYQGKRLNSPNDVVQHPDGSYWFTDPPYGGQLYEGAPDAAGGPSNADRPAQPEAWPSSRASANGERELAHELLPHRSERPGRPRRDRATGPGPERPVLLAGPQEALRREHRQGPGDQGAGGKGDIHVFDVGTDNKTVEHEDFLRLHGGRRKVRA